MLSVVPSQISRPDAGGLHVSSTWASPGAATRLKGSAVSAGWELTTGGKHGSFGAAAPTRACAPAAVPPATIAGPPTMVTARHVPASARSHGLRRRRRVPLGNLDSSTLRPP